MRRFQLFRLEELKNKNKDNNHHVTFSFPELIEQAENYIAIAKKIIEPLIKDPLAAITVNPEVQIALLALKNAAEIYEQIESWDDALFAWHLIEAVPVNPALKWNASERIIHCESMNAEKNPTAKRTSTARF